MKETSENVCFYFMIGFLWSLYPDTIFLWCGNNKYLLELIKRRSKVQEKNMSCERALNFDQWKIFSENYKPMRVWLCLQIYRELLSLATFLSVHSNSEEVSDLSWQNMYPNLKTTGHMKLKFFLWTILLDNLLLAKYLISVAAPLTFWASGLWWYSRKEEIFSM